jgi:hypothetical protein
MLQMEMQLKIGMQRTEPPVLILYIYCKLSLLYELMGAPCSKLIKYSSAGAVILIFNECKVNSKWYTCYLIESHLSHEDLVTSESNQQYK